MRGALTIRWANSKSSLNGRKVEACVKVDGGGGVEGVALEPWRMFLSSFEETSEKWMEGNCLCINGGSETASNI